MNREWVKWYPGDFLADVMPLTAEEIGAYAVSLMLMLRVKGALPRNSRYLSGCCGCSARKWNKLEAALVSWGKFVVTGHDELWAPILDRWKTLGGREAILPSVRKAVFERDGFVCAYCGGTDGRFEIDHIQPWSRGGSNDLENLTVACQPCNRNKRDSTLEEWLGDG